MKIEIIPILKDNYAYFIESDGITAIIDPGEAQPIIDYLRAQNKPLTYIINTHHHGDHIAGNEELREKYGAKLVAPKADMHRIHNVDIALEEGTDFTLGKDTAQIFETPGHTTGHMVLYFANAKALFSGDTLFSMGCGRLFEGTANQMWRSFEKIIALPGDTLIYPGHEYTLDNAKFCMSIEPENNELQLRLKEVEGLRAQNKPTIPVSLEMEMKTNAFLRAGTAQRFSEIRELKNNS